MGSHPNKNYQRPEYVTTINGIDTVVRNPYPNMQKYSGYSQINFLQNGMLLSFKVISQRVVTDKIAKIAGHFYRNSIKNAGVKRAGWPVQRTSGNF